MGIFRMQTVMAKAVDFMTNQLVGAMKITPVRECTKCTRCGFAVH